MSTLSPCGRRLNPWEWTDKPTIPINLSVSSLQFINRQDGFLLFTGSASYPPVYQAAALYATTDGGRIWTPTVLPAPPGYTIHNLIDIGTPQRISASLIVFPSIWRGPQAAQSLVATEHWSAAHPTWQTTVGTGTAALRTPIQTSELTAGTIAWSFLTSQRGWMVVGSTIYRTTTGGRTWSPS